MAIKLTTPVGRIVQGELWKGREQTDNKGAVKLGADGKPIMSWFFAIAIAKQPGHTHWAHTDWGRQIWDEGHRAHPNFAPHPTFSWKIEDGDSVVPNKKGKKNCDREGHPGHWIVKFSSFYPITDTWNANGTAAMPADAFKPGHYVQVRVSVKGNTGDTPGVYLNPEMVALSGYGTEISFGGDPSEAGFGNAALPAGAQAVPVSAALPSPSLPGAALPGTLPTPGPSAALPAAPTSVVVTPNTAILAAPGGTIPAAPGALPLAPPPAAPTYQMTALAGGFTRDQYAQQGWTDAQLREKGMML